MILMYHKIDKITPTKWWVTQNTLIRHIDALGGKQFVYLDEYEPRRDDQVVITFDDAYENVYRYAFPILKAENIPFEVFAVGDSLGAWNDFDPQEPRTRLATLEQLREMAAGGGRIQWHTRSHKKLPQLTTDQLESELSVPEPLALLLPHPNLSWFAYPYGAYDQRAVALLKSKFSGAVAGSAGEPADRWRLRRAFVEENSAFLNSNFSTRKAPNSDAIADVADKI